MQMTKYTQENGLEIYEIEGYEYVLYEEIAQALSPDQMARLNQFLEGKTLCIVQDNKTAIFLIDWNLFLKFVEYDTKNLIK